MAPLPPRPGPTNDGRVGQKRAFSTITLLALHRHGNRTDLSPWGEIGDPDGRAALRLLQKMGIQFPVVPDGLSGALHDLKGRRIINAHVEGTRTYAIFLQGHLTTQTVEALGRDEEWARKFINGVNTAPPSSRAPEIQFERPLELTAKAVDDESPPTVVYAPAPAHSNGSRQPAISVITSVASEIALSSPPTANEGALLRYILELEKLIRAQRGLIAEITGESFGPGETVSDEVLHLLEGRVP
jgi:hypothetical protein